MKEYFTLPEPWMHVGIPRWQVWAAVLWNYMIVAFMIALCCYIAVQFLGA